MGRGLLVVMTIICLTASAAQALEGWQTVQERKVFEERRFPAGPPYWVIYKTKEEIAWDLLMYGFKNIPSLHFRVKHYEDLLEAYRKALNVVENPKEPIPPFLEKEKTD